VLSYSLPVCSDKIALVSRIKTRLYRSRRQVSQEQQTMADLLHSFLLADIPSFEILTELALNLRWS
jgi:hypothetical protein